MKHMLFSQDKDQFVKWFDKYDKDLIKNAIIEHLTEHPADILEHCKEYSNKDLKKYYGYNIISFYGTNKKFEPCKIITKGNKDYFYKLKTN